MAGEQQRRDPPEGGGAGDGTDDQQLLKGPWWYSERRSVSPEQRQQVLSQLFYEGADRIPFLSRFAVLMAGATLLAVFGLAQDSGPVVIGAMLIAPLTTPILGLATALVLGHPGRQGVAALILLGGTAGAIALAFGVMFVLPDPQQTTLDSPQLLARTDPDLVDLAIAVVAGAAGAYVLVRHEAVSALPGVAIAVALVPPLTAVGMTLELGRSDLAGDALLLYLTNLAGIILAAALVMLLLGVGIRPEQARALPRRIKLGLTTALLGAVVVAVPLIGHTRHAAHELADHDDAERHAERWLAGTDLRVADVELDGTDAVTVVVEGPSEPPDAEPLARTLAVEFEEPVAVTVEWAPLEIEVVEATP